MADRSAGLGPFFALSDADQAALVAFIEALEGPGPEPALLGPISP